MAKRSRSENAYYQARIEAQLSVQQVAAATGYDKSTVYKVEQGKIQPKEDYITRFANVANIGLSELPSSDATGEFKYNEYVERIVKTVRSAILPSVIKKADINEYLKLSHNKKFAYEYDDHAKLNGAILNLLSREAGYPEGSSMKILWTGRNYEEFSSFYEEFYNRYIPLSVKSGTNVLHLLRDGISAKEKLGIVAFILPKLLKIRHHELFSIRIVRNLYIQSYVNDMYNSKHSGSILSFTTSAFGEPSQGLWTDRRTAVFDQYLRFVEDNSDERVLFLPQERRKEFFEEYLTTESRTGDWVMLQKLPANSTRPISDFAPNTRWSRRVEALEKARNGPAIAEIIRLRRTAARFFRDRLASGRFRQIASRKGLENWIVSGTNPDVGTLSPDLLDDSTEIKNRLKNLISLMDDTNGNFQIALADEERFESLGWSQNRYQSVAWVVQGLEGTVFEGHEEDPKQEDVAEYNIMVRDAEFSKIFERAFNEAWKSLPRRDTDQNSVREFLVSKLREVG